MSDRALSTVPAWQGFDASWYRRRYRHVLSAEEQAVDQAGLARIWAEETARQGRSPNRFFDEEWYLHNHPSVQNSVEHGGIFETGFQHYADVGYRYESPHWLFSEETYFQHNRDISFRSVVGLGYWNGYDHFIRAGDKQRRFISRFFCHDFFIAQCVKDNIVFDFDRGAFAQYLSLENPDMGAVRTSWYFDPHWYLERYPDIRALIEKGYFVTPLHHYLCNTSPQSFDPNPYFSEVWYLERYPDVREALEQGHFRNGYAHFLHSGVQEWRQPQDGVDLAAFAASRSNLEEDLHQTGVDDVFALWIRQESMSDDPLPEPASVAACRRLAVRRIQAMLPSIFRSPLCFESHASSASVLSVIILSAGDYVSTLATLAAIHAQNVPLLQPIVVSMGNAEEKRLLKQATRGVNLIFPDQEEPCAERIRFGLEAAKGETVLLLHAGVEPLPGVLRVIHHALQNPAIAGGCGQVMGADGNVLEAGCRLWRDGTVMSCGAGQEAYAPGICFGRSVEAVSKAAFFARRSLVLEAWPDVIACGLPHDSFLPVSIALRGRGHDLLYVPELVLRCLDTVPCSPALGHEMSHRLRRIFPAFLARHALPNGDGQNIGRPDGRPAVVMVFPFLPRREEGGAAQRIFERLYWLGHLGWNITIIGLHSRPEDRVIAMMDYPPDVECLSGMDDMGAFLAERHGYYDVLWVVGTDVLASLAPMLEQGARFLPKQGLILDTVAQDGRGLRAMEAHLRRLVGACDDQSRLLHDSAHELNGAWLFQCILAADEEEAALIRRLGYGEVHVLPSVLPHAVVAPEDIPGFDSREGILFPLPIYHPGDPGHDAFDWFCLCVIPELRKCLPDDVPLWVGGYHTGIVDLGFYDRFAQVEGVVEPVPYETLLQKCRVLVAPARVMNMRVPELLEAAEYGLPMVLGAVLYDRLGWCDGEEVCDGGFNDPARFARTISILYTDKALWEEISKNARHRVRHDAASDHLCEALRMILALAQEQTPPASSGAAVRPSSFERCFAPAPLRFALSGERLPHQSDAAPPDSIIPVEK